MRRNKKGINKGRELEEEVAKMLDEARIPYEWENTLRQGGRKKGSVDFITENALIECKHYTDRLTYKINSEEHDIKWSQICKLNKHSLNGLTAGFVTREQSANTMVWLSVKSLLKHYIRTGNKSIKREEVEELGRKVENMDWLNKKEAE